MNTVAIATRKDNGEAVSISERRQRISVVGRFLTDIAEWGWPDAPARRLIFPRDMPREPRPLPRYIPLDADRRLQRGTRNLAQPFARRRPCWCVATGVRIGELLNLELDCVHEVPGLGSWLKVPLGKFDTERMVPLDEETVAIIDRLVAREARNEHSAILATAGWSISSWCITGGGSQTTPCGPSCVVRRLRRALTGRLLTSFVTPTPPRS